MTSSVLLAIGAALAVLVSVTDTPRSDEPRAVGVALFGLGAVVLVGAALIAGSAKSMVLRVTLFTMLGGALALATGLLLTVAGDEGPLVDTLLLLGAAGVISGAIARLAASGSSERAPRLWRIRRRRAARRARRSGPPAA